jgi:anti-sigma-K factor RskA
MKDHAQFAEDLALYAMGALDQQACPELQAHLGICGECRHELENLRSDLALLAISATGPQPPQRSRRRLMDALAAGEREEQKAAAKPAPSRSRLRWLTLAPIAAAVLLAALCAGLLIQNQRLKEALTEERVNSDHAKALLELLNDPSAQHMTLVAEKAQRQPQIKTIYQKKKGHVLVFAYNLDPIPANKVYQLWLVPANGGSPMPCGTFRIDGRGNSMMMHKMEYGGVDAKSFAVTVEPVGGSEAPTAPVVYEPAS